MRHLVAAGGGIDAEPLLDQREVLVELAEQRRHQPVVVEGDDDVGLFLGERGNGAPSWRTGVQAAVSAMAPLVSGTSPASVPNRLLVPTPVIDTRWIVPIRPASPSTWTGGSQGERPTIWPSRRPGRSNSTSAFVPTRDALNRACCGVDRAPAAARAARPSPAPAPGHSVAAGVPGRGLYLNEKAEA